MDSFLASQLSPAPPQSSLPAREPSPPRRERHRLLHEDGTIENDSLPPKTDEPLMTRSQRHMLYEFQTAGRLGLGKAIYAIGRRIRDETPGGSAMDDLIEDGKDGGNNFVFDLLETLPDMIIESLIKCTLPYDYHDSLDADFKRFVRDEMQLTATPGIYANFPCYGGSSKQPGKCMTGKSMRNVLDKAEKYFLATPADAQEVTAMDDYFKAPAKFDDDGNGSVDDSGSVKQRWDNSDKARRLIQEWLSRMEAQYIIGLSQTDQDQHFVHCAVECGWGDDMQARAVPQKYNKKTTYLFAIYNVLTRMEGYGEPMQLVLFPTWKRDTMLFKIATITGHILCSTLWTEGGLNCAFPDNMSEPNASDFSIERNAENLVRRRQDFHKMYKGGEILETVKRLETVHRDAETAEKSYNVAEAAYQRHAEKAKEQLWLRDEMAKIEQKTNELAQKKGKVIDASRPTEESTSDPTMSAFEDSIKQLALYKAKKARPRRSEEERQ